MSRPRDYRYGASSLKPNGWPEDPTRCVDEVWNGHRGMTANQCSRKRGFGPNGEWCKQHGKRAEERERNSANAAAAAGQQI